jgi:glycosyltransferase involved in cell wall biosynthesis
MRIAVFTDNDFNKINGVTTTLRALLQFAPADVRVRIYTADAKGADDRQYLALRAASTRIPYYPGMTLHFPPPWSYLPYLRRDGVDVIHLTTPGPVGLAALFCAWRLQVPLVGSFHTDLATYTSVLAQSRRLGDIVGGYLRWPYGCCERVLVPSQATAAVLDRTRVALGKHVIWQRGVDADVFAPTRRSEALRRQWGADEDTPVVIYVGRVSREKNLAAFVTVHERLIAARLEYRLVFVGDGPMRSEIEQRLPDAIVTGAIPHGDVGEYLASADVFAFPSRTDTAGNVVLEAQAAGLPVVIGDEGGPRENVRPGQSALVTRAGDDDSFATAVERLVTDRPLRAAMSREARAYALTRDWPSSFVPLFETYKALMETRMPTSVPTAMPVLPGNPTS